MTNHTGFPRLRGCCSIHCLCAHPPCSLNYPAPCTLFPILLSDCVASSSPPANFHAPSQSYRGKNGMSGSVFLIIPYHPWCWQGVVGWRCISLLAQDCVRIRGCLFSQMARKDSKGLQGKRRKGAGCLVRLSGLAKKSLGHPDQLTWRTDHRWIWGHSPSNYVFGNNFNFQNLEKRIWLESRFGDLTKPFVT